MARRRRLKRPVAYGDFGGASLAVLGLAGVVAWLLLRKSSIGAPVTLPATPTSSSGILLASASSGGAPPDQRQAILMANTKSTCQAAGGHWVAADFLGLSSTNGACVPPDPQSSATACANAGGDWVANGCSFEDSL